MTNSLQDGLSLPDLLDTAAIQQAEIGSGAILAPHISGGAVGATQLATTAVTAVKQKFVGTGSPTGYGLSIQTGSTTASDVAVVGTFGTAFAAAPFVYMTIAASGAAASQPPCVTGTSAGSFTFLGQSGLLHFWTAVGSGAI